MKVKKIRLKVQSDPRGWSADMFKTSETGEKLRYVYLITSKPGTVRGNHYHLHKNEWFCLVKGTMKFFLFDNVTKEKKSFTVKGASPVLINIPPKVTHAMKNTGREDAYILELATHEFDKDKPDTYRNVIL